MAPDLQDLHADDESQATTLAGLVLFARGHDPVEIVESSARREYGSHWGVLGDALVARARRDDRAGELLGQAVSVVFGRSGVLDEFTSVYGAALTLLPAHGSVAVLDQLAEVVDSSGERLMRGLRAHRDLVEALRLSCRDASHEADEEVARHYEAAVAGYDEWGSPVYAARATAAYAAWLRGRGRDEEAAPLVEAARSSYTALGAVSWLAELEDALTRPSVV